MTTPSLGEALKASMRFSDLVFVSHGHEFPAHGLVVMARSPVLEKLIQSGELSEVDGKRIIQVSSAFSPQTVEHLLEYLYAERYLCIVSRAGEGDCEPQTTTPELTESATTPSELTGGDVTMPEASNDAGVVVDDLLSLNDAGTHPVIDNVLVLAAAPTGPTGSSDQQNQDPALEDALIQHLHVLGLANIYQVQALADIARGHIAAALPLLASAGPAMRLIEEMKTAEMFDAQVRDMLVTCVASHLQDPLCDRLLAEVLALGDALRSYVHRQESTHEQLKVELAKVQTQSETGEHNYKLLVKAQGDLARAQARVRDLEANLVSAGPALRLREEVRRAFQVLDNVFECRNSACSASWEARVWQDPAAERYVQSCVSCSCSPDRAASSPAPHDCAVIAQRPSPHRHPSADISQLSYWDIFGYISGRLPPATGFTIKSESPGLPIVYLIEPSTQCLLDFSIAMSRQLRDQLPSVSKEGVGARLTQLINTYLHLG
ncbi:hypothetical protein MAPG_00187 [Magnaporthiopsis poae ATCC 64411]|uniref:BTB domain-containing protein n=1 Tax=Magnaporthiopsis poae (strain ATCC 64411 / 73-15) TaxID=644358 RepID=A0A0C4DKB9_MAGP6|nr:hypothetical protein MAPG_00187 [Magnaporthiopsis poae ATCC 64411]